MKHAVRACVEMVLAALALSLGIGTAAAVPRYSARYEQNCGLCHVNPTGGGERTLYATQFLVPAEMSAHRYTQDQMATIDPRIGKSVTVGLDLRTVQHHADRKGTSYEDFLQMEGAVHLAFQLDPRFLAYVSRGLSSTTEVFGLGYLLPCQGYIKVGRFVPAFGWRSDDHTMFTRAKPLGPSNRASGLGGEPPSNTDVGLEAGVFPGRLAVTASVVNGNMSSSVDNNDRPAYTLQSIYRGNLAGIGLALGGSLWYNNEPPAGLARGGGRTAGGPYGYLKWKGLTWLAEADWSCGREQPIPGITSPGSWITHRTISQELAARVVQGLELRGTFDIHDPDVKLRTGARSRYGAGFEYMPYPFVALHGMVNAHHFTRGKAVTGQDYTQSEVQVHFFF